MLLAKTNQPIAKMLAAAMLAALITPSVLGADFLVADWGNNNIGRYDADTGEFKGIFILEDPLNRPLGMAYGPDGNLYVSSGSRILRYDGSTGAFIDAFVDSFILPETGRPMGPEELHFGEDGFLYVQTNSQRGGVVRFDAHTGGYLGRFIDTISQVEFFFYIEGMAVGPEGDFYLSALRLDRVYRFDGRTGLLSGEAGFAHRVGGVAIGPDANVYVTGWLGDEVRRFTRSGQSLGRIVDDVRGAFDLDFLNVKAGVIPPVGGGGPIFQITDIDCDFAANTCTITWASRANISYTVEVSMTGDEFNWLELADSRRRHLRDPVCGLLNRRSDVRVVPGALKTAFLAHCRGSTWPSSDMRGHQRSTRAQPLRNLWAAPVALAWLLLGP